MAGIGLASIAAGGVLTGVGFGLGYGASLPVGFSYGQTIAWKRMARARALQYLYEQVYRVYTDYYVQSMRLGMGLRSQFDRY